MFVPNYVFETVYDIPMTLLKENGITCLLLDIDNTLVPYDAPLPTDRNKAWFDKLSQNGIRVMFVSNNNAERVKTYVGDMGIPFVADAGKPGVKKYKALLWEQGVDIRHCAAVGDQIFTDVVAASRLGVKSFLVKPIKDVENAFFRFKRFWEKPFLAVYKAKNRQK